MNDIQNTQAKCPFYLGITKSYNIPVGIRCGGECDPILEIKLTFDSTEAMHEHFRNFCISSRFCKGCCLYHLLIDQYAE